MRLRVTSAKDFWSAALLLTIACIAGGTALHYPAGTLSKMGSGYFPLVLSGILALVAAALLVRSFTVVEAPPAGFRPVAIICVLGGTAAFAGLVESLGLAVTSLLLIIVTYLGGWESSWRRMLALGLGMATFVSVLFIVVLHMQLRIGPAPWN